MWVNWKHKRALVQYEHVLLDTWHSRRTGVKAVTNYCVTIISLVSSLLKQTRISRIHSNCNALPTVCLVIDVFSYLKRIPEVFLPSSTPHLSKSFHFIKFEVQNQLPTLPHKDLYKTEPHSPDPNMPFHLSQQNIIIFNKSLFHTYLA